MSEREEDILGEEPIAKTPDGQPIYPSEEPVDYPGGRPKIVWPLAEDRIPDHENYEKAGPLVQLPLEEKIIKFKRLAQKVNEELKADKEKLHEEENWDESVG